jgi:hypothetical protein
MIFDIESGQPNKQKLPTVVILLFDNHAFDKWRMRQEKNRHAEITCQNYLTIETVF